MTRWSLLLTLLVAAMPRTASARAKIMMQVEGTGLSDTTPVQPVGGNAGKTLGEQRRLALEHAFELWSMRLDSQVPILIHVKFSELGCMGTGAILAGASPTSGFTDLTAMGAKVDAKLLFVSALADSLVGRDLRPGEPDVEMSINASVDGSCKDALGGFYYGFDAKSEDAADFVSVIMHEFAHGIGVTALWDSNTGDWAGSMPDSYSAHVRDVDLNKAWPELSAAERVSSATNARHVVWDGPEAARMVADTFAPGEPSLRFEPQVPSFTGLVADADFGKGLATGPVSASVVLERTCAISASSAGRVVLFLPPSGCKLTDLLTSAMSVAPAALLLPSPKELNIEAPAMPWDASGRAPSMPFPILSVSTADVNNIVTAARNTDLRATVGVNATRHIGADEKQRPLLFAVRPFAKGSSVSHLEELVRPSQLMEPIATVPTHDLNFTMALLRDVGWVSTCGNGTKDPGEECDDGSKNSDSQPDACRNDCRAPRCGDGVRDKSEACDSGRDNDDTRADTCRTTCKLAACGDGVLDRGETCDRGPLNSDREPDRCRMNCHTPSCGDGVVDALEQCDLGPNNSDTHADTCRSDCRMARCGDGVVDQGERCDQGKANGDAPNACRRDCAMARCGDGIVDNGEECDGTPDCSAACKRPTPPSAASDAGAGIGQRKNGLGASSQDGGAPLADAASDHPHSGCGCRTVKGHSSEPWGALLLGAAGLASVARRRRRTARAAATQS